MDWNEIANKLNETQPLSLILGLCFVYVIVTIANFKEWLKITWNEDFGGMLKLFPFFALTLLILGIAMILN